VRVRTKDVEVRVRARICPELEACLLGFAEEACVVRPKWLRERLEQRVLAAAAEISIRRRKRTRAKPRHTGRRYVEAYRPDR
jgi:hypothetical protein